MQYLNGRNWREEIASELKNIHITCFDPYKKPFIKDVEEDEVSRKRWKFGCKLNNMIELQKE